jgi:hypothetical protein
MRSCAGACASWHRTGPEMKGGHYYVDFKQSRMLRHSTGYKLANDGHDNQRQHQLGRRAALVRRMAQASRQRRP